MVTLRPSPSHLQLPLEVGLKLAADKLASLWTKTEMWPAFTLSAKALPPILILPSGST